MSEIAGRVAFVTGGAGSLGVELGRRLSAHGAAVCLFDANQQALDAALGVLQQAPTSVVGKRGDVTRAADLRQALTFAADQLGASADILVNNCGIWVIKPFLEHTEEEYDRIVDVNLKGTFLACQAVLPRMIERRHGNIVNITSLSAVHHTGPHSAYVASKAAIMALTREIAYEMAGYNIQANCVGPGYIDQPDRKPPLGKVPSAPMGRTPMEDIAELVCFLASDRSRHLTGQTMVIAGGADIPVLGAMEARPAGQHWWVAEDL